MLAELLLDHLVQHQVSWSEVVGPLRSAMDLVYTDHANLAAKLSQVLDEESLWRYEQDFDLLLLYCSEHFLLSLVSESRVYEGSGHEVWKLLELILH